MPVIKFQHLINSLSGEPASLLRGIEVEGDNFDTAWQTLVKRYDDKLLGCNTYIKVILEMPSASEKSVTHLNQLLSTMNESLNVFNAPAPTLSNCDALLVYCITSKLAPDTQLDWAKECEAERITFATYQVLRTFLETRIRTLDCLGSSTREAGPAPTAKGNKARDKGKPKEKQSTSALLSTSKSEQPSTSKGPKPTCLYCSETHYTSSCKQFLGKSLPERRAFVQSSKLCFNCMGPSHQVGDCLSKNICRTCQSKHHTALHMDQTEQPTIGSRPPQKKDKYQTSDSTQQTSVLATFTRSTKLLSTAIVSPVSDSGLVYQARALLDSCLEESYLSDHVARTGPQGYRDLLSSQQPRKFNFDSQGLGYSIS
ncbi:uncharacterized protein LOC111643948 [Copidosoma floridanum]|uniref:uncharacterized protein LOC111643948 n=1 Tax=Copidosoma floridanum TaxID=29053 RepID=UPI000C6F9CDF|nr:uncharacterized protein LOC111643948 [Copidosoma floridanum]